MILFLALLENIESYIPYFGNWLLNGLVLFLLMTLIRSGSRRDGIILAL